MAARAPRRASPTKSKPTRRASRVRQKPQVLHALSKVPTGIVGFDEVTGGGIPEGRPTLVCGGPGCGKTLFGLQFLILNAIEYGRSGVFVSFEESEEDLVKNVASLGYDLADLVRRKLLTIEYVHVERSEIEETGEYDLEALFIRLDQAFASVGARLVVLDTIESLFAGLIDAAILRAELRRLFRWLKQRRITAVITGERGERTLTRQGLEEYVSDCVVLLDHRVSEQVSTRRLRVVKYRGSSHGTNEYPFLIDRLGIAVLPVTSLQLVHTATSKRISSGLPWVDAMMSGLGFFRSSSILISGGAGTAKTSLAAHFLDAACARNERALAFQFEESPQQYIRNMRSIGLNLEHWVKQDRLRIHAARPTLYGLEFHLATMHRDIEAFDPSVVVIDPLSSFTGGTLEEVKMMLMRLIDYLKGRGITALFTHLISGSESSREMDSGVSSLMDTWILLRNTAPAKHGGRYFAILKSRGMPHASDEQRFELTARGAVLLDESIRLSPASGVRS